MFCTGGARKNGHKGGLFFPPRLRREPCCSATPIPQAGSADGVSSFQFQCSCLRRPNFWIAICIAMSAEQYGRVQVPAQLSGVRFNVHTPLTGVGRSPWGMVIFRSPKNRSFGGQCWISLRDTVSEIPPPQQPARSPAAHPNRTQGHHCF